LLSRIARAYELILEAVAQEMDVLCEDLAKLFSRGRCDPYLGCGVSPSEQYLRFRSFVAEAEDGLSVDIPTVFWSPSKRRSRIMLNMSDKFKRSVKRDLRESHRSGIIQSISKRKFRRSTVHSIPVIASTRIHSHLGTIPENFEI